ncbi:MAG: rpoE [Amycolatopsis sp.]|nr:rpoE [Amycolatopsis sp.]
MIVVEDELLASAMTGDRFAMQSLLGMLRPVVTRYCRSRLGAQFRRDSDADDCAQEILLGVLVALPRYRYGTDKFLAFVYGIAAHKVVDARRRYVRDVSSPVAEFLTTPATLIETDHYVEDFERRQRLDGLLDRLPARQREIVILRVVLGLSAQETADTLGMASAGAVRVGQHRALATMRGLLADAVDNEPSL